MNKGIRHPHPCLSYGLSLLVLLSSLTGIYFLSQRMYAQFGYQEAWGDFKKSLYSQSRRLLERALPYSINDADMNHLLARIYLESGYQSKDFKRAGHHILKAKEYYLRAKQLNPLEAEIAFGLAKTEAALERSKSLEHATKDSTRLAALPFFQEALTLWPTAIHYHYVLAHYFFSQKAYSKSRFILSELVRLYPPACDHLRKEPLWRPENHTWIESGLKRAIELGNFPKDAYRHLALLNADIQNWIKAAGFWQQGLDVEPGRNTTDDYFYLGRLFLKLKDYNAAQAGFIMGIDVSHNKKKHILTLYNDYYRHEPFESLVKLQQAIEARLRLHPQIIIEYAKTLMHRKRFAEARLSLQQLNKSAPSANTHYLLAQIERHDENWNRMAFHLKRASAFDPQNETYHLNLFNVYKRLGKLDLAERELDQLITSTDSPKRGWLDGRGKLRWWRGDVNGAIEDWEAVLRQDSTDAQLRANLAEAYIKTGNLTQAIAHYREAVALDPGNERYKARHERLLHGK